MSSMMSPTTPLPVVPVALSVPEGVVGILLGAVLGTVVGLVVGAVVVFCVLGFVLGGVDSVLLPLQPLIRIAVRTSVSAIVADFFILYLLYFRDFNASISAVLEHSHVNFPECSRYFGKKQKISDYPLLFSKTSIIITKINYIKETPLL